MEKPLHDVRVLDLSRVLAGPLGSMILGDLGADVIRIEAPGGMDDMRSWAPFLQHESTYYLCANRNKRSITLNLKEKAGKDMFEQLVKGADVVIENFKTGTLERLGLDYRRLESINPKIILCSVTGYGQTGPFKHFPGYDPVIQAVGGLMDVTGQPDGEATRVGVPVVDLMTSHYVAISILAALRSRDQSGEGQHIDLSLLDVQVSSLGNIASSYLLNGKISKRIGNEHGNIAPYESFDCEDKPIVIAAGNDRLYSKLCHALNRPEWITDERFQTNPERLKHRTSLKELIQSVLKTKQADEWTELLSQQGIPCGAVNNIKQVFEHPQVRYRKAVEEVMHPKLGAIRVTRSPIRFSKTSTEISKPPPELGEHTDEILVQELGLTLKELKKLRENGVI
ncbi:CoA transferase [bacterium LRH843]|nr:CoA transferase [bacterium LRH843]